MDQTPKIHAFDYLVSKLHEWFEIYNDGKAKNDLSKLKVMKLLFFTAAISSNRNQKGLLETFNNFVALPYGHVESDVYSQMENSLCYEFDESSLSVKEGANIAQIGINVELKNEIDSAISKLRTTNNNLINYAAFDLVDISHKWQSWKMMYSLARKSGRYSMKIPNEMIMTELKTFI
ncbi:type II toxin-antitoxin system antitoxin SocA domain-containing protein [Pedobacter panaciterrae]|uniref:type II toxin-antitoxin system antitoxin SocA domain-containing protein n=1 Tax=Pedobacter panaciterrae TaxID=363849 RepID=UPI00259ADC47|nr:type II toxin-antitoxin system antitoxin SocA domain-containing protein [uncultured Pedobacter sp.]